MRVRQNPLIPPAAPGPAEVKTAEVKGLKGFGNFWKFLRIVALLLVHSRFILKF